jgi:hypothetical protein
VRGIAADSAHRIFPTIFLDDGSVLRKIFLRRSAAKTRGLQQQIVLLRQAMLKGGPCHRAPWSISSRLPIFGSVRTIMTPKGQ